MRVLQIIDTLGLGGAETLLSNLCPRLAKLGVQTTVMCLTNVRSSLEESLLCGGTQVLYSPWRSPYFPLHVTFIAKHLFQNQYDLVHSHLFPAQLWAAVGAIVARSDTPFVTTEHSTWNRRRRLPLRLMDRWMYRSYRRIACIGGTTEAALRQWLGPGEYRTDVIPNGIDTSAFSPQSKVNTDPRYPMPRCRLVCVASLTARKGHATLLRAISQCEGAELVLVGVGPERDRLGRLAAQLEIADRVRFLGARTDVAALLGKADIYVQPSLWEGFGIAAVEAMASGIPVVASNVPGLSEVIGDAGLLFNPGSEDELRDCINHLVSNPPVRSELGNRSRTRALRFSVDATADAYLSFYTRAIGDRRQPLREALRPTS